MQKSVAPEDTIQAYLNLQEESSKQVLSHIDNLIRSTVPAAEPSISYGMPAYKYRGKPLIYYGSFKGHVSLFPTSGPIAALQPKLKKFQTGKGTLQFTPQDPLPDDLIVEILRARIDQIDSTILK